MNNTPASEQILELGKKCVLLSNQMRPELQWLNLRYRNIQDKYHLKNKQQTDLYLYQSMYHQTPPNPAGILKIRYWRTGRHVPINRDQCLLFGEALELSPEDMQFLIQGYYDRSLEIYNPDDHSSDSLYLKRCGYMKQLTDTYIQKLSPESINIQNIPLEKQRNYLRHLYFLDAFHYIHTSPESDTSLSFADHLISKRYDSEFSRQLKLLGEIPRQTMLRHLIIFGLPELTLKKLNEQLVLFGYLPLHEEHTLVTGERLDYLLIHLFEIYESFRNSMEAEQCLNWFQEACRMLDRFFIIEQNPRLEFMYFKALHVG